MNTLVSPYNRTFRTFLLPSALAASHPCLRAAPGCRQGVLHRATADLLDIRRLPDDQRNTGLAPAPPLVLLMLALMLGSAISTRSSAEPTPEAGAPPEHLFKGAVPIQIERPDYPRSLLYQHGEGWVVVGFCIDESGVPRDIVVTDSTGQPGLDREAVEAVEQWRFEPATLDGEPVMQCKNGYRITFRMNPPPEAAGVRFARRYRKASRALDGERLDEAGALIAELEDIGMKNLYEWSLFWFLRLREYAAKEDVRGMRRVADRIVQAGAGYLPAGSFHSVAVLLFKLYSGEKMYAEALDLYERYPDLGVPEKDYAPLAEYAAELRAVRDAEGSYGLRGEIDDDFWSVLLFKRSFYLTDVDGEVEDIEIRCSRKLESSRSQADQLSDKVRRLAYEEHAWIVPPAWGDDCRVLVFGDDGTSFTFVQQTLPPPG